MELRLIYGAARAGKSTLCLSDIGRMIEGGCDKPLIMIVPEQYSLEAEKSLARLTSGIRHTGAGQRAFSAKAEVLSFKRLAYRILNETGGAASKRLNQPGRMLLLTRIIEGIRSDLEILAPSASHQGFIGIMSSTVSELKRYNVTCEALEDLITRIGCDEYLGKKLSEIYSVYSRFQAELEGKYRDVDDDLADVSRRIVESDWLKGAYIWIDEFSSFTPQEYGIIAELLSVSSSVAVALSSPAVFEHIGKTAERLSELAANRGAGLREQTVSDPLRNDQMSRELAHLEKNLYIFPCERFLGPTADIEIYTASNPFSEVENCAKDIIRLCREQNFRFRDILIASGDAAAYESIISAVFPIYGIPFFIDIKKPVERNPLIEFIKCSLDILCNNWKYEAVFRYLKTGLANIKRGETDVLENYVLAYGIKGSMWFDEDCWNYPPPNTDMHQEDVQLCELHRIRAIRERFAAPLRKLSEALKGEFKAIHACQCLYEFLCEAGIPERLDEITASARASGELTISNEYRQVWNIVMDVLDQFVDIFAGDAMTVEVFNEMLANGFSDLEIGLIPPSVDQVVAGTLERSRSRDVKILYILGANDGLFPAPPRNEGIISDSERARISDIGVELAQDTRSKVFEDEFTVYRVLSKASCRLILSYSIADSEGRSLRPSTYISRVKRIFPGIVERSSLFFENTDASNMSQVTLPEPTFNSFVSFMRKYEDGFDINEIWDKVMRWYQSRTEWESRMAQVADALHFTPDAVPVDSMTISESYGDAIYTSISRIESYISCPFAFYVKYGLYARERKRFRIEPPDAGTFMHDSIERFFKQLAEKNADVRQYDYKMCFESIDAIVDEMLDSMPVSVMNSSSRFRYITGRLKRIIARSVYMTSEHYRRSGFQPYEHEVVFGRGGQFPSIKIDLSEGRHLMLSGRIDRIDVLDKPDARYVRIVDYKSGDMDFHLSDAYYGLQLQLVAYLDAICSAFGAAPEYASGPISGPASDVVSDAGRNVYPGAVLYYHLDDPIIKTDRICNEEESNRMLMKELRTKGLVLNDTALIKEMDRGVDGASLIIPVSVKNNVVSSRSSAATLEQFDMLRRHVRRLLRKTGDEMVKGRFPITPYKKKSTTSCKYCSFLSICQFEPALSGKGYRMLKDYPDEEVWTLLQKEDLK